MYSHNFTMVPDPSCACGCRSQTTRHILFHCPLLLEPRRSFFENLYLINNFEAIFESLTQMNKINTLLFGNEQFSQQVNQKVVSNTAECCNLFNRTFNLKYRCVCIVLVIPHWFILRTLGPLQCNSS
jgi:hypothetical protein